MSRLFGHGDLRLWLLKLLSDKPRHGYEIIGALEEQFLGVYSPSPGTVYPRLAALQQEGLVTVVDEQDGRKVYALTDAGRAELSERSDELREIADRLARSAREIARDIKEDVKASVRDIRREIKEAARDVRHVELDTRQRIRAARDAARGASGELRTVLRSLQSDLDGFVAEVVQAARTRELDGARLSEVRDALKHASAAVIEAFDKNGDTERNGDQPGSFEKGR